MNAVHPSFVPQWVPGWLVAAIALAATAAVAAALLGAVRPILRRTLRSDQPLSRLMLEHAGGFAQFALTLLAAEIITPFLPISVSSADTIKRLLLAAFVILAGWVAIIASDLAINRYVGRFRTDTSDNLLARKAVTQMRILKRTVDVAIAIVTIALALMTFDAVRQFGVSLFASAGIAGIAVGFAAKPLLENLVAGLQLAITQPIRIDDVVIIDNEWGWIEEITSTYVVLRCWDWRRLVVPISYLMTTPFQNWTRTSSSLIGSVYLYCDYSTDVDRIRARAQEIARASRLWDGHVFNVQVSDISERSMSMQVRILVTSSDSGKSWDLRCELRERMLAWMRDEYPDALPRWHANLNDQIPHVRQSDVLRTAQPH
ncbi:MAG: mechanosensitive ion channel family protein [Alphaproteobacteria bacterium]|nr:mechanosensitive ion channel family protein [Alphaproteobacteria bacterium]